MTDFFRCILCDVTYESKDNVTHVLGTDHVIAASLSNFKVPRYIFRTCGPVSLTGRDSDKPTKSTRELREDYDRYTLEERAYLNRERIMDPRSIDEIRKVGSDRVSHYNAAWKIAQENAPSEPVRDRPETASVDDLEAEIDNKNSDGWEDTEENRERMRNNVEIARVAADDAEDQFAIAALEKTLEQTRLEQEQIEAEQTRIQMNLHDYLEGKITPATRYDIDSFDDSDYDYDSEDFDESTGDSD